MLKHIEKITRKAAQIIAGCKKPEAGQVEMKGSANYVTCFDKQIQDFLISNLSLLLPEAKFLAEESEIEENYDFEKGYTFIIDPIDGTANFVRGCKQSAISVGLSFNSEILYAVTYNPFTGELFSAERRRGAHLNGERIFCAERDIRHSLVCIGASPYYPLLWDRTIELTKKSLEQAEDIRRSGASVVDICNIACGRYDVMFELMLQPWDYAASSLILKEAGGIITDIYGNPPPLFSPSSIIAGSREAYKGFVEKVLGK